MLYWLIPYLVAYNASHVSDWKYGPEHVFKAEIRTDIHFLRHPPNYCNVDIYMPCRTLNLSFIECRIESTSLESYKIGAEGNRVSLDVLSPEQFGLNDISTQVEFNEKGIKMIRFMNDTEDIRLDMIRMIIGVVNLDFNLADKNYGKYVSMDNSTIGTCNTNITISKNIPRPLIFKPETLIKGYTFNVPAFGNRSKHDEVVVIEKYRNLNNCSEKTPNFLAYHGIGEDPKEDKKFETKINSSRSLIYLGKNSFSAYTRNTGTYTVSSIKTHDVFDVMNYVEVIRVSLDSIRPSTRNMTNKV